jgi:hypothetical protein
MRMRMRRVWMWMWVWVWAWVWVWVWQAVIRMTSWRYGKDLAKAQNDAVYWQSKQVKSLKELWIWRGLAAITLASLAGWLALRMGFKFAI